MMASSKVMATASTTNTDLSCQQQPSSICPSSLSSMLADDPPNCLGSMNMDDLLKNIYATPTPDQLALGSGASIPRDVNDTGSANDNSGTNNNNNNNSSNDDNNKSVDEVWKQIVAGGSDQRRAGAADEEMTLEDFLTKAGAVREEDVRPYGNNNNNNNNNINNINNINSNNNNQLVVVGPGGGGGRGKRRIVEEPPMDKATQQKQRRMIKNRESAARSRERKQAYTVELESLVTQLEEEKARLLREEDLNPLWTSTAPTAEQNKQRFKQLMENLIPVVEKRRPPRVLRRVNSLHW